jgi:hypothetical protein
MRHQHKEVEEASFCWVLREFVRERGSRGYTGVPTWILANLNERATEAQRNAQEWPKTPNQLGHLLNKYKEGLLLKGVRVSYFRHGLYGRLWTVEPVDTNNAETLFSRRMRVRPKPTNHT